MSLKILLSGAYGLIGTAVRGLLEEKGYEVWALRRGEPKCEQRAIYWNPDHEHVDKEAFEGFDVVIHLAGENIAKKRWTKKRKALLFQSRARDTWLLSELLARLQKPPKVFLCASAVGFYGDRGSELLTEESSPGRGFLADLCVNWEKACGAIKDRGTRTVHLRFGYVLSGQGGMLREILPIFRLGLGGKIGDGKQIMPWVALDDVAGAIAHCIQVKEIIGPVNIVAPQPVSQLEFAKTLASLLHRPCIFPMPKWILKVVLGKRADELLLTSCHALPKQLLQSGYRFQFPSLNEALKKECFIA